MEKRHRCKLCFRNFANGRALGGHMRSHMMKFYDEAKKKQKYDDGDDDNDFQSIHSFSSMLSSPSSSSSSSEEESEEVKAVLVDRDDFYLAAAALQDKESETESSMKTRKKIIKRSRRSKRVSRSRISDFSGFFQVKKRSKLGEEEEKRRNSYDRSSLSSISDTTPEEHVAHCLIMLSRDKWGRAEVGSHGEAEGEEDFGDGKEKKFGGFGVRKVIKTKVRGKYRCEECNKMFKSYQALGGHRASHKKVRAEAAVPPNPNGGSKPAPIVKLHECPFCERVFSSGQALGGHKRSHFIGPGAVSGNPGNTGAVVQNLRNVEILNIDLNLPAPMDDEENSQIAVSAVSDAEFVHPIKL